MNIRVICSGVVETFVRFRRYESLDDFRPLNQQTLGEFPDLKLNTEQSIRVYVEGNK